MAVVTRTQRLAEYAAQKGPRGAGRDMRNIDYWVGRAHEHSDSYKHRASGSHTVELPNTGIHNHDTHSWANEGPEMRERAKRDLNFSGNTSYMRTVRRIQG
jgi:hypothetical protein